MKKLLFLSSAVAVLTLASCKKNESATIAEDTTVATEEVNNQQAPVQNIQEELLKEAQGKPLTNIVLAQSHYDFGKVKKGESVQHVYEITNTGTNPLIINAVQPGCGCTAPDFTKEPIMPGQKGNITLHFDSTNFDGKVDKYADVFANVENAPIRLTFTADVQP